MESAGAHRRQSRPAFKVPVLHGCARVGRQNVPQRPYFRHHQLSNSYSATGAGFPRPKVRLHVRRKRILPPRDGARRRQRRLPLLLLQGQINDRVSAFPVGGAHFRCGVVADGHSPRPSTSRRSDRGFVRRLRHRHHQKPLLRRRRVWRKGYAGRIQEVRPRHQRRDGARGFRPRQMEVLASGTPRPPSGQARRESHQVSGPAVEPRKRHSLHRSRKLRGAGRENAAANGENRRPYF